MTRSIRIAKLLVASSHEIDLGGGFTFKETTNPRFSDAAAEWSLFDSGMNSEVRAGYLATYIYFGIGHTIADIYLLPDSRGQGLGEKMVRTLVDVYGSLSSDPQGNTSPSAIRMWQRMGAEKVPTNKNTKGYFYKLTK